MEFSARAASLDMGSLTGHDGISPWYDLASVKSRILSMTALVLLVACLPALGAPPVQMVEGATIGAAAAFRARHGLTAENLQGKLFNLAKDDAEGLRETVRQGFLQYVQTPRSTRCDLSPTSRFDLLSGHFDRIEFEFAEGGYEGIRVKRTRIVMENARLDLAPLLLEDKLRFKSHGRTQFLIEIGEDDINKFVFQNRDVKIQSPRIELRAGALRFTGRVRSTALRVDGNFQVVEGGKIHFVPQGVKVSFIPIPGFLSDQVFRRLNPIADLERLQIKVRPDRIVARPGRLFIVTEGFANMVGQ